MPGHTEDGSEQEPSVSPRLGFPWITAILIMDRYADDVHVGV